MKPRQSMFLQTSTSPRSVEFMLSVAAGVLGCNTRPNIHASEGTSTSAVGSTSNVENTQVSEATGSTESSTNEITTSPSETLSVGSSTSIGGNTPQPCETWNDACPDGMKCVPYATIGYTGLGNLDAQGCFPLPTEPGSIGVPCKPLEALNAEVIHLDTCEKGVLCWDGTCVPLCQGSIDSWVCPDGFGCAPLLPLAICLASCDPLSPACDEGEVCEPASNFFQCSPSTSENGIFETCEMSTDCAEGLVCSPSSWAAECLEDSLGCCNSLCDLQAPSCPGAGQECVQFYAPPPSGYENLGVCMVPA